MVRPDGLLAATPLGLRFAPARRRAARVAVQLVRRRPSCRTDLFVRRRFESLAIDTTHADR
jgi:hypothetical protein